MGLTISAKYLCLLQKMNKKVFSDNQFEYGGIKQIYIPGIKLGYSKINTFKQFARENFIITLHQIASAALAKNEIQSDSKFFRPHDF